MKTIIISVVMFILGILGAQQESKGSVDAGIEQEPI